MSFAFDAQRGLIIVSATIVGMSGSALVHLALDTGATRTLINGDVLEALGYLPDQAKEQIEVTTGSRVEIVPSISIKKLAALGHAKENLAVICHTLPPSAGIDGVLGLDFLRGGLLTVDFRDGRLIFES
jgi:predicted aspartyl protease